MIEALQIQGMKKRKGVKFPCCPATVMGTKANKATVLMYLDGKASK